MDMLYSRYSNPLDLMNVYINQGRFGAFVTGFLEQERKRKEEETEKDEEMKLWIAYIHSHSGISYGEWRKKLKEPGKQGDQSLDDAGIESILTDLFPKLNTHKGGET